MTTTQLPAGIYRIAMSGDGQPKYLTRLDDRLVTILPPSGRPDQEWQIAPGEDGNIIIERPAKIFPATYLTYNGAPGKPEEGNQIVCRVFEFPPNKWHLAIAPGFRSLIRVAGSDLGIRVALRKIYPPGLELGLEDQLQWMFERVSGQ